MRSSIKMSILTQITSRTRSVLFDFKPNNQEQFHCCFLERLLACHKHWYIAGLWMEMFHEENGFFT